MAGHAASWLRNDRGRRHVVHATVLANWKNNKYLHFGFLWRYNTKKAWREATKWSVFLNDSAPRLANN
jgi:hypothetical protein